MNAQQAGLTRGEPDYERHVADLVFNALPLGRVPDALVRPSSEGEVAEAVRAARAAGQPISVLSGGHSWIGAAVLDQGVLIDMAAFDGIEIDADARTARVGTAARSGDVAEALAAQGFAFPTGHCGLPGIGGFILGGGFGLNVGRWKPACFSLRSVRVVTAAGEVVVANATENPELLWLARGAGPAFPGVITELELELQDRPADTRLSTYVFALDDLPAVTRWVNHASSRLPSIVEVAVVALGPDRPGRAPDDGQPDHVVSVEAIVFADDAEEARRAVHPLASGEMPTPVACSELEPVPYEQVHVGFDAMCHDDHRYLADTFWTDGDLDALALVRDAIERAPSGKSVVMAEMVANGATFGLDEAEAAYAIDARTLLMVYAIWERPDDDDANRAWHAAVRDLWDPVSIGHFVNEAALDIDPGRLARCFTPANWERIVALRSAWDPDGSFRLPCGATDGAAQVEGGAAH
jgi:FAD/FMN-containing dehydrogenase